MSLHMSLCLSFSWYCPTLHAAQNEQFPVHRFPLTSSSCVLTFSDHRLDSPSFTFALRRQSDAQADWDQTSEDKLLLTSCCARNNYHCQWKTDVEGDRKWQRGISSSRHSSRLELWERAQLVMRISFCKHLEQSVSGYWHPRVLHSHIFRDTKFELTAQDL